MKQPKKKAGSQQVLSSHSDISTKMGERIEVFIMDKDIERIFLG